MGINKYFHFIYSLKSSSGSSKSGAIQIFPAALPLGRRLRGGEN